MFKVGIAVFFPISLHFLSHPFQFNKIEQSAKTKIQAIAHRGGSMQSVQNTLEAFRQAYKNGCRYMELDVYLTKDQEVVIAHDSNLERICKVNKNIKELSYNELPELISPIRLHFTENQLHFFEGNYKIPLLKQLITELPECKFHIQLKHRSPQCVKKVGDIIRSCSAQKRVSWGTVLSPNLFDDPTYTSIKRFATLQEIGKLYISYIIGILPFINLNFQVLSIPLLTEDYYKYKNAQFKNNYWKMTAAKLLFCCFKVLQQIDRPMMKHLRKRGIQINYWVLNSQNDWSLAVKKREIDGIMTDMPKQLIQYLNKVNQSIQ